MKRNHYLHEIVATAIIVREGKYLIVRRSQKKNRFPGMWVVPGGRLEVSDHMTLPKDTKGYSRNVLEEGLKREVLEEVGLVIDNIEYVTNLATVHADGNPSMVISCSADHVAGEVCLQKTELDAFKWVTLAEAEKEPLLDGLFEELIMVERSRRRRGWAIQDRLLSKLYLGIT